jgi:hypothetical protein
LRRVFVEKFENRTEMDLLHSPDAAIERVIMESFRGGDSGHRRILRNADRIHEDNSEPSRFLDSMQLKRLIEIGVSQARSVSLPPLRPLSAIMA